MFNTQQLLNITVLLVTLTTNTTPTRPDQDNIHTLESKNSPSYVVIREVIWAILSLIDSCNQSHIKGYVVLNKGPIFVAIYS